MQGPTKCEISSAGLERAEEALHTPGQLHPQRPVPFTVKTAFGVPQEDCMALAERPEILQEQVLTHCFGRANKTGKKGHFIYFMNLIYLIYYWVTTNLLKILSENTHILEQLKIHMYLVKTKQKKLGHSELIHGTQVIFLRFPLCAIPAPTLISVEPLVRGWHETRN